MSIKGPLRKGLVLLFCVLALAPRIAGAQTREYQIKAAFLLNFAQFVEWPAGSYPNAGAPFSIGVLGDDPFKAALDATVQGETVANRTITIVRSREIDDLKQCQMIFVSKSEKGRTDEILSALEAKPVLTVSETDGFAARGGAVNFYLDGTKVRFEINPVAARTTGLKFSSQLLSLGKIVPAERRK
jgi:hypothetical protein